MAINLQQLCTLKRSCLCVWQWKRHLPKRFWRSNFPARKWEVTIKIYNFTNTIFDIVEFWYTDFLQQNVRSTIVGVTSFGQGCGDPNYPGVYARVTEVRSWIKSTVSGTQDSDCKFIWIITLHCVTLIIIRVFRCNRWHLRRPCWWANYVIYT